MGGGTLHVVGVLGSVVLLFGDADVAAVEFLV
jgi:hypothetical protein